MSRVVIAGTLALIMTLTAGITNNAYAHGVGGCLAGCPVGGGTGYRSIATDDMNVLALIDTLSWLGTMAFIASIGFGVFVLFKNRASKVTC